MMVRNKKEPSYVLKLPNYSIFRGNRTQEEIFFEKFFEIFFEIFDPPEPYYLRGSNNLVISGHNLVPFCYRPSFYRGRNNIFEESQNGYFFNFGKIFSEGCAPMGVKMIFPKLPTKEVLGYRRSSKNQIPLPYIETRFQKSMC